MYRGTSLVVLFHHKVTVSRASAWSCRRGRRSATMHLPHRFHSVVRCNQFSEMATIRIAHPTVSTDEAQAIAHRTRCRYRNGLALSSSVNGRDAQRRRLGLLSGYTAGCRLRSRRHEVCRQGGSRRSAATCLQSTPPPLGWHQPA